MESQRFDAFARSLATGINRRMALKRLFAGAAAVAVGGTALEQAEAKQVCRVANQVCRKGEDCCSNFCGPKDRQGRQKCDFCPDGGQPCGGGSCCPRGQSCLNGACCENPCGEGPGAVCCAGSETCLSTFVQGTGYVYSCCADELACNDNTVCCADGDTCVGGGCCAPENVCNESSCCAEGTSCTQDGCCEDPCVAGQNTYCCLGFETCDPVEGCVGIG